jgi:hypothetical protein
MRCGPHLDLTSVTRSVATLKTNAHWSDVMPVHLRHSSFEESYAKRRPKKGGLDRFRLSETEGCRCCSWRTRPAPEEAVLDDYADRRCLILQAEASTGGRTMSPG